LVYLKYIPLKILFFDHRDRQDYNDSQKTAIGECSCEIVNGHLKIGEWQRDTSEEVKSAVEEFLSVIESDIKMGCRKSVLDKYEWVIEY
jgi:hypothetical protein